ncbi:hypothetical protein [Chlorobium phaeobacteroides]|jgi:hypothetical protein|nr:hypothetical protein [Chlorobium phaeobacteroides]MBV5328293.1 hypothetical protein [Chlorobium sp.]
MIDKPTFSNYNQYIPKFLPFNKLAPVLNVEAGYTRNHFVQISENAWGKPLSSARFSFHRRIALNHERINESALELHLLTHLLLLAPVKAKPLIRTNRSGVASQKTLPLNMLNLSNNS